MVLPIIFAAVSLLVGLAMTFAPKMWMKIVSYAILIMSIAFIWEYSLGNPRPSDMDLTNIKGDLVTGWYYEPKAIYVVLEDKETNLPTLYSFKWDETLAAQLNKALYRMMHGDSVAFNNKSHDKVLGGFSAHVPTPATPLQEKPDPSKVK